MQHPTTIRRALLATLCVAALVVTANGRIPRIHASGPAIYYVSPSGSDSDPGTQARPWKTLAHTVQALQAGDTAVFMDGTYDETQQAITANDGTAAAPITIEAQHQGAAKIVWHDLQSTWGKLAIANSYWTVQGFEFTENGKGTDTNDVLVFTDGVYYNPNHAPATHVRILDNTAHGAYEKCYKFYQAHDAVIDGNVCYDITHDGIDVVQSDRVQISDNEIYHVGRTGIFEKGGSRSPRVFGNYVHEDGTYSSGYPGVPIGIELGDETDANASLCSSTSCYEEWNGVAYDNVVVSNPAGHISYGLAFWACKDCAFYNNVVVGAQTGLLARDSIDTRNPYGSNWAWDPQTTNPRFIDNIVMNATQNAIEQQNVAGLFTHDYNLWYNTPNAPSEAHSVYADPRFVDPSSDWRLQAGSPAIGAGTSASFTGYFGEPIDLSYDRAGVSRSTPWDIGAYAYGGVSPAVAPQASPTVPSIPPTAPSIPPTSTPMAASVTPIPPISTPVAPTVTSIPPTVTSIPPTAIATAVPSPTAPSPPVLISRVGQTGFGTGFEGNDPQPTWNDTTDFARNVGGICCGLTHMESSSRQEIAHTGGVALLYSGYGAKARQSFAYNKVFNLRGKNITVTPATTLSYWIYPQNGAVGANGRDSTHVAIDIIFTDGSNLRDSGAVDQYGVRLHPRYQGEGGRLIVNAWNHVVSNIGAKRAGKTIDRLLVGYDQPRAGGPYRGYIDDIQISG